MKRALLIFAFVLLTACAHQETVKFVMPSPPAELMAPPAELAKLPDEPLVLSNVTESVVQNYITAFENKSRLEELQSWLRAQLALYGIK